MIDLHIHSDRSDGSDPPERVAELAARSGCTAIALTDHDRLEGIAPARTRGRALGVEVIGGCELSCDSPFGTLHLLAYFLEDEDGPLQAELGRVQRWRAERNARLAERMAEVGLPVTLEEMEAEAGADGVGRPHAAAVLVRKGVVPSVQAAFDEWLAEGRPAYVDRARLGVGDAARLVRGSGGVAVLAHPLSLGLHPASLERAVAAMAAQGVAGVEAIYGRYRPDEREMLAAMAGRHDLVVTGGSDYHGAYKPDLQIGTGHGDLQVPDEILEPLEARRPSRWARS